MTSGLANRGGDVVPLELREFEAGDEAALDTSFTSTMSYEAESTDAGLRLRLTRHEQAFTRRFEIDWNETPCEHRTVAVDEDRIVGLAAAQYEAWNRRLRVWHFYVDRDRRRQGIGQHLMEHVMGLARRLEARTIWLEISNRNTPAAQFYRAQGFELCGFDLTLYRSTPAEGEFAVFMARTA